MVKLTGSPNYKVPKICRLSAVVEELLPLGLDEKPTGTAEIPPHIKKVKLSKLAIDDKANVVEMDDAADQDLDEDNATGDQRLFVEPDFGFVPYYDDQEDT
uniref:DUF6818 domain-containing protein n=1 Tax=Phytophthora ramorum TaxID=164328 RepID=H3H5D9_PHYRM